MTPIMMLLAACFSDVTRHSGCDELKTADLKYYHMEHWSEDGKKYIESQTGKELFIVGSTVGYTVYKRQLVYHIGSYGFKLTNSEIGGSIKFGF